MKVSTRVHYGLRAMTELARSYREERLLSISEIAQLAIGRPRRPGRVLAMITNSTGFKFAPP